MHDTHLYLTLGWVRVSKHVNKCVSVSVYTDLLLSHRNINEIIMQIGYKYRQ